MAQKISTAGFPSVTAGKLIVVPEAISVPVQSGARSPCVTPWADRAMVTSNTAVAAFAYMSVGILWFADFKFIVSMQMVTLRSTKFSVMIFTQVCDGMCLFVFTGERSWYEPYWLVFF